MKRKRGRDLRRAALEGFLRPPGPDAEGLVFFGRNLFLIEKKCIFAMSIVRGNLYTKNL